MPVYSTVYKWVLQITVALLCGMHNTCVFHGQVRNSGVRNCEAVVPFGDILFIAGVEATEHYRSTRNIAERTVCPANSLRATVHLLLRQPNVAIESPIRSDVFLDNKGL